MTTTTIFSAGMTRSGKTLPGELGRLPEHDLLTPREVARAFRVDPKTVTRWAKTGQLSAVKTLGGHHRYPRAEVEALLHGQAAGNGSGHAVQDAVRDAVQEEI